MACCVQPDTDIEIIDESVSPRLGPAPDQVAISTDPGEEEPPEKEEEEALPVQKKVSISEKLDTPVTPNEEDATAVKPPTPKSESKSEKEILRDESISELPQWIKDQIVAKGCKARRRALGLEQTDSHSVCPTSTAHREASRHHLRSHSHGRAWKLITQGSAVIQEGGAYILTSMLFFYLKILVIGACSCALTFYFNHDLGFTSVLASSMVGVMAHSFPSPYREVAFAATFGGMGGHLQKPGGPFTLGSAFVLGIVIGVVYLLMESVFNGVGGKLGLIAFISGVACAAIGIPLGNEWKLLQEDEWEGWTLSMGIGSVIAGTVGCTITQFLMYKQPGVGSTTLASATVGLASIFLLQLHDEPMYGSMWSAFAYTGSFAGMTAKTRLMPPFVVLAGFLGSAILLLLWPLCPGVGGKYGVSALMAVLIVEFLPGAQDPKYDPKTWLIEDDKDPDFKGKLRRGSTGVSFGSLVMQHHQKLSEPDWVDWIPPTTWEVVADWLAALQKKDEMPSGKQVSDARLAQRVMNKHYGLVAPKVRSNDALEVRRILNLCCIAERRARPPPDTHADGEQDPTSIFASQWFRAVAQDRVKLRSAEALPLLKALEAEGVGLVDEELDLGEFTRCVRTRRRRREEKNAIEQNVRSGFYS